MNTIHIESLKDEEAIVTELHQLHEEHTGLFVELREEMGKLEPADVHRMVVTVQDAQPDAQHQEYSENADEFATKLKKNCSFMDGSILNLAVKFGLKNSSLAVKTEKFVNWKASEFVNEKSIQILKDQLLEEVDKSDIYKPLHITLRTSQQRDRVTNNLIKSLIKFLLMEKVWLKPIDIQLI